MKYIKEGGVAISCGCEKEDLISATENIKSQLGEDYEVNIVEKKCPKIKIVNVYEKIVNNENFIEKLIQQYGLGTEDLERKVTLITHYKGNNSKKGVVIEVDPSTYGLIKKKKKGCR